jgi:hypothetical protein
MPIIANPRNRRSHASSGERHDSRSRAARSRSAGSWLRVAVHKSDLTDVLASGGEPLLDVELSLRAAQLTSDRNRKTMARTWRRTIAEAHQPAMARPRVVIIQRGAVLDAEPAITAMIDRLQGAVVVAAQGMAMAEQILTDGWTSPLYNAAEPGALGRRVRAATAAMDSRPAASHEFAIEA